MEFRVLSLKEEEKLNRQELLEYYAKYREYVLNRKLTNTTPFAAVVGPKLKGITNKIAIFLVKLFSNDNVEWKWDGQENIPDGPVIFAHTHQGLIDNFVWMPAISKHCLILHHQDVNKFLLLGQLNTGLVLVRKGDKVNNHNAKLDMVKLLMNGSSIAYFPEGTWNLSPNKLHLPLSFGIIDTAKKAKVPIVPIAHEYVYDTSSDEAVISKIHTRFGKPIYVLEEDNLLEKLEELSSSFSTMKFELIEENGVYNRSDVLESDYIKYLRNVYKNLELSKTSMERENSFIFGAGEYFREWYPINDIPILDDENLAESSELLKMKEYSDRALVEHYKSLIRKK